MDELLARWQTRIREAAASGGKLRPRGGGSKDFYGGPLAGEVLDTREFSGIVAYEPTELVITLKAGTALDAIEAALAERGQMLAFEPPRYRCGERDIDRGKRDDGSGAGTHGRGERGESQASHLGGAPTAGGIVAAGLAGPRRQQAGSVRDYVLGLRLFDGRGELLHFGGEVMKNVAGYDVARLMTGSLGTLGLITEVSLKVLPRPAASTTLAFEASAARAIELLNRWGGQPLPISASCWLADVLTVRLEGAGAAVAAASLRLGGERVADPEPFWTSLRDQTHAFFADRPQPLWRLALPSATPPLALPGPQLIEWGGGQRWFAGEAPAATLRAAATAAGGHATLFRGGAAVARATGVFTPLSAPLAAIHRRLKDAFDPAGVFSPGRLYPDL